MDSIDNRLDIARREIEVSDKYDYKIINDNLDNAVKELESIIKKI